MKKFLLINFIVIFVASSNQIFLLCFKFQVSSFKFQVSSFLILCFLGNIDIQKRVQQIIDEANKQTAQNSPVWGAPSGTSQCGLNFKVVSQGIYFHETNAGFNQTSKKYDPSTLFNHFNTNGLFINSGSEINVLIFESALYSGVAYGNHITLHNVWSDYVNGELGIDGPDWHLSNTARVLWHEIMHNNGLLNHPFSGDDCADTPTQEPTCWDYVPNPIDCYNSNNLMNYNSQAAWSLSPCQICQINQGYNPNYVVTVPPGCTPAIPIFTTRGVWTNPHQFWLDGSATTGETKHFIEIVPVDDYGSTITVGPYVQRWFSGEIGSVNLVTYMPYNFCDFGTGWFRIKLAVMSDCAPWAETVQYVNWPCTFIGQEPLTVTLNPNPANQSIELGLNMDVAAVATVRVVNSLTGTVVKQIANNEQFMSGLNLRTIATHDFPDGVYYLQAVNASSTIMKQFVIKH
jgi:hypothetical protein